MSTLTSLWEATAAAPVVASPLDGPHEADILIIGAGYTGLSTALHLAEAGHDVCVLEAAEPGAGGSGRNGGQVIPGLRHLPDELIARYGAELGRRLHAFGAGDADETFALIARLGLACDATRGGWLQAAETEVELEQARLRVAAWVSRGVDARMLGREEFQALTGTSAYCGGWADPRGGSVQPLSYVRELARAAMRAGARLHTHSPAIALARQGHGWRVSTPHGAVTSRRLLLASNVGTGALHSAVHRSQLSVWSFQIATRPLSQAERAVILPGGAVVSDTRRVLRYFRTDRDGRVIVGGKGTLAAPRGAAAFRLQRAMLQRLYPDLAHDGFSHAWGGQIGVTLDRLPRLFSLGPGGYAAVQDNGKGIAWCTAMGRPLAALLSGEDPRTLPLVPITPPAPIPAHALKSAYVAAGNLWLRFLDMADYARAAVARPQASVRRDGYETFKRP